MAISLEYVDEIEQKILDKADKMKERNVLLQGLARLLRRLKTAKDYEVPSLDAESSGVPKPEGGYYTYKEIWKMAKLPDLETEKKMGLVDYCWGKTEREEAIPLIREKLESLNSNSQNDMIDLQNYMGKRDNIFQSISNILKTDQRARETIAASLR